MKIQTFNIGVQKDKKQHSYWSKRHTR